MPQYANAGGRSNVASYDVLADGVAVRFQDGSVYTYTVTSAGASNIARMKELATAGQGLNSFINRYVRLAYASRSR